MFRVQRSSVFRSTRSARWTQARAARNDWTYGLSRVVTAGRTARRDFGLELPDYANVDIGDVSFEDDAPRLNRLPVDHCGQRAPDDGTNRRRLTR
jgi:hypothetical protein